jgi:hypothetical protein
MKKEDPVGMTLLQLEKLINQGFIEDPENIKHWYYTSVMIAVLVHLDFILQEINNMGAEIDFTDDIPTYKGNRRDAYHNVTTLLHFFRNAACHAATTKRLTPKKAMMAFVYQHGLKPDRLGMPHLCQYEDDIAMLMGHHVLYVKRHILRAFKEAKTYLGKREEFGLFMAYIEREKANGGIN